MPLSVIDVQGGPDGKFENIMPKARGNGPDFTEGSTFSNAPERGPNDPQPSK